MRAPDEGGVTDLRDRLGGNGRLTPAGIGAALGLALSISRDALRDLVWRDVRTGLLDLGGLSRATRVLVILGFGLLLAAVGALLFNDLWRSQSQLLPIAEGVPGRGTLLPAALAPATLFLVSVAWSYLLVGALHAHPAICLGALFLYVNMAASWITQSAFMTPPQKLAALAALLAVPATLAIGRKARPRPALEFSVLLLLVGTTLVLLQAQGVQLSRSIGSPLLLGPLNLNVVSVTWIIWPLLVFLGLDLAEFAGRAASWTTSIVTLRMPAWAPPAVLLLLLVWRGHDVGAEALAHVQRGPFAEQILPYVGGLFSPLTVGLAWLVVARASGAARRPDRPVGTGMAEAVPETVRRHGLPLILAWLAPQLVFFVLLDLSTMLLGLDTLLAAQGITLLDGVADQVSAVRSTLSAYSPTPAWRLIFAGAACAAAAWLARRGHVAFALYLLIYGLLDLRSELSSPGRVLSPLASAGSPAFADFWWVALSGIAALFWAARRELTAARAGGLLFLVLATLLLRQTDFLANRFAPLFGSAGVGFVAFALLWDAWAVGAWANRGSPALPRISRVFLYVGYALLAVTVVNWAVTAHDLGTAADSTGYLTLGGFERFGRPMLFAQLALILAPLAGRPTDGGGPGPARR